MAMTAISSVDRRTRNVAGWTVLNVALMLAGMLSLALLLGPRVDRWWRCHQVENKAFEIAALFRRGWIVAGEQGATVVILIDIEKEELVAFLDHVDVEGRRGSDLLLGPTLELDQATGRTAVAVDEIIARLSLRGASPGRDFRLWSASTGLVPQSTEAIEGFTAGPPSSPGPRLVLEPTGDLRDAGHLRFGLASDPQDPEARPCLVEVAIPTLAPPRAEIRWFVAEPEGQAGYYPRESFPEGAKWCF